VKNNDRVLVVGSGPSGACAALFLAKKGVDVLLLEAGAERALLGVTARVRGITVAKYRPELRRRTGVTMAGDPGAEIFEELGPGGLSNHWSCAVPRFSREDFADAARSGEVYTWPIGYDDLAPFYDRVEPLLHVAASASDLPQLPGANARKRWELGADWDAVIDAAKSSGRTIVAMPYAYGADTMVTLGGTAFNAYVRLVRPELRSGRLSVRHGTRVLRLVWSPRSKRVEAAIVRDRETGREERVPCRAVVLAAGAVNSAQILLESAHADFPDGLGNTHGVLGRYLHDHPLGKLVIDLGKPMSMLPAAYVTRAALDKARPLYAAACMQWSGAAALARSVLSGRPGKLDWIGFSVFGTMAPAEHDFVALDRNRPPVDGVAALTLHARHPREAGVVLDEARDDLVALLERAGWQPRVRVWKVEAFGNSVHYGGTCRMHASPKFGVLDGWNRVHGVKNVVVGDSAAFTTGPEKNPALTGMALAARASERLATELTEGDL
jgi:choline dehydrogenase-like flavoprotein